MLKVVAVELEFGITELVVLAEILVAVAVAGTLVQDLV